MSCTIIIPNRFPDIIYPLVGSIQQLDPGHRVIVIAHEHDNSYGFEMIRYDWPVFSYSHAVNLGIAACNDNVILLNDDCKLVEPQTFSRLESIGMSRREIGLLSPLIKGCAGNPIQLWHDKHSWWRPGEALKYQHGVAPVCFPCVWIKRSVLDQIGPLDETITTYGGDDNEYCIRMRMNNYRTAVTSEVVVQHGDGSPLLGDGRGISWSLSFARVNPKY